MKLALGSLSVLILAGAGWMFRYAYLPPIVHMEIPTRENPIGRLLVVCKANRWTGHVTCDSVSVDLELGAREMKQWMKDREKK